MSERLFYAWHMSLLIAVLSRLIGDLLTRVGRAVGGWFRRAGAERRARVQAGEAQHCRRLKAIAEGARRRSVDEHVETLHRTGRTRVMAVRRVRPGIFRVEWSHGPDTFHITEHEQYVRAMRAGQVPPIRTFDCERPPKVGDSRRSVPDRQL